MNKKKLFGLAAAATVAIPLLTTGFEIASEYAIGEAIHGSEMKESVSKIPASLGVEPK